MGSSVEFDILFEYTIEISVKLKVNIPRQKIPLVCSAFEIIMAERYGASFYYPRYPNEQKNKCRYEWFLDYKNDPYGIRISTFFDVETEDIKELPFFVSWGPRFTSNIGTQFSEVTQNRILEEINSVLSDVNKIISAESHTIWTFIVHIDLPPGRGIEQRVVNDIITVYPSVRHKKEEGHLLSAVGIHIPAHFREQAKILGLPIFDKFIALLSLLAKATVKRARVKWPKNFKFNNAFEGKDVDIDRIYPMTHYQIAPPQEFDLTDILKIVVDLMLHPSINNDESLWQSIYAYVSGQGIMHKQPTLSSVAFIASLAAYSKEIKCDGNITCSKCGALQGFRHNLVSEKNAIIETIRTTLGFEENSEEMEQLQKLIGDIYYKQRTPFVHDAVLRHAELDKENIQLGRPTKDRIVRKELAFMEDILSIQGIARRVLLCRLLSFDERIQAILDSEKKDFRIRHDVLFTGSHTLRAKHPIGIKFRHDEKKGS